MKLTLLICTLFLCLCGVKSSFLRLGRLKKNAFWKVDKGDDAAFNFTQKVDHFDLFSGETFQQRYWVNDTFFKMGGNNLAFIMVSGEAPAHHSGIADGHWIHMAQKFGAICFMLEHRFYGNSRPTSDLSVDNLRYLSAPQALSDLVNFIEAMNEKYKLGDETKWVAFGGSYAGTLVAWLRLKYPHVVAVSVSSSGPLLAKADFFEYYTVVRNVLESYSENNDCVDAVKNAFKQLKRMESLKSSNIDKDYRLCSKLSAASKLDKMNLYESLASNFAGIVQYNEDNRPTSKVKDITVSKVCDIMRNTKLGEEYHRMAYFNSLLLNATEETCLDISYKNMIDQLSKTSWKDLGEDDGRQWFYQTCTEFGFYQTSDMEADMFTDMFPLQFFIQQCRDVFGPGFNSSFLDIGIDTTNTLFGGKEIQASNVIFINGNHDPWHPLGLTNTEDNDSPVILIQGTAHCANMYEPSEKDPESLREARLEIEQYVNSMILYNHRLV